MRQALLLFALSFTVTGCNEEPEKPNVLREVIDVQGTCFENHVGQPDSYAGQIVRWESKETGEMHTYGSITNAGDFFQRTLDEVTNPTVYHTPFMISFENIDIDTGQPKWLLHGLSVRAGDSPEQPNAGYDSTCDLEVVKRGMEIRPPDWLHNAPKLAASPVTAEALTSFAPSHPHAAPLSVPLRAFFFHISRFSRLNPGGGSGGASSFPKSDR